MTDAYEYIVNLSSDFITLIDRDYRYVLVNDTYCLALGVPRDEIISRKVAEVWGEEVFATVIKPKLDESFTGSQVEYVDRFRLGGTERFLRVTFHPYRDDTGEITHVLTFTHEITSFERDGDGPASENEHRDRLTGLLNRRAMEETLEQQLAQARRSKANPTRIVLFLAFRNFKAINRTHGHRIGDLLLENTALRVSECLRGSDFVFRLDGANFVALLTEVERPSDASFVALKIQDAVTVPYHYRSIDLRVLCHIGIAIFPDDAESPADLLQMANSASVEAEERDEPFLFYDFQLHETAVARAQLRTQLQRAFEAEEFELFFQPLAEIGTGEPRVVGAEVLLRWHHPERGLLTPGSFLKLAEDTNIIRAIDKWSLFEVCRALARLERELDLAGGATGVPGAGGISTGSVDRVSDGDGVAPTARPPGRMTVSVNVATATFIDAGFIDVLAGALEAAGNPDPSRLCIELTESGSVEHAATIARRVEELQHFGIGFWIDDFGVGQSSLAMLKQVPADGVKIDRSFSEEIDTSPRELTYLRSIVDSVLARNKAVIIEGIETEGQLAALDPVQCRLVQGFHIGDPVPYTSFVSQVQTGVQ